MKNVEKQKPKKQKQSKSDFLSLFFNPIFIKETIFVVRPLVGVLAPFFAHNIFSRTYRISETQKQLLQSDVNA